MRRLVAVWAMAAGGALVLAPGVLAGELDLQGSTPSWESTACIQPVAPTIDKTDATALNASINRYNRFVAAVDQYNRCLRAEADTDIARFSKVINDEVQRLQAAAIADAEAVRADVAAPRDPSEVPEGGVQ